METDWPCRSRAPSTPPVRPAPCTVATATGSNTNVSESSCPNPTQWASPRRNHKTVPDDDHLHEHHQQHHCPYDNDDDDSDDSCRVFADSLVTVGYSVPLSFPTTLRHHWVVGSGLAWFFFLVFYRCVQDCEHLGGLGSAGGFDAESNAGDKIHKCQFGSSHSGMGSFTLRALTLNTDDVIRRPQNVPILTRLYRCSYCAFQSFVISVYYS